MVVTTILGGYAACDLSRTLCGHLRPWQPGAVGAGVCQALSVTAATAAACLQWSTGCRTLFARALRQVQLSPCSSNSKLPAAAHNTRMHMAVTWCHAGPLHQEHALLL
jgi:hypothetical protein